MDTVTVVVVGIGLVIQWLVIYTAVLSALRQARKDRTEVPT